MRWRELQRQWVESWQGRPPPESEGRWGDWWKGVKTQHTKLLAAAVAELPQLARQEDTGACAGKRRAAPEGTPNKGGQRKDAPATRERGEGSSAVHALLLPPSQVESVEAAEVAEVIAVIQAVEIAEAAEAAGAAEVAEAAEAAAAAAAAEASQAAEALHAAVQAATAARDSLPVGSAEWAAADSARWVACAVEWDALAPELAELFKYDAAELDYDAEWNNSTREHAHSSMTHYDDWDLESFFAGCALELMRRKIDISVKWRRELCALLKTD